MKEDFVSTFSEENAAGESTAERGGWGPTAQVPDARQRKAAEGSDGESQETPGLTAKEKRKLKVFEVEKDGSEVNFQPYEYAKE